MEDLQYFVDQYRKYLENYLLKGGEDDVLYEAYLELVGLLDESSAQAANLLDIHNQALKDVLNIRQDNDMVQWIYIERATEFLAQILIATDAFLLSLKEKAERDPLTSMYNRFALKKILKKLWSEAHATGIPLTVAMLDIDNFKEINDRYGHTAGDELLKEISQIIKKGLRSGDQVIRYGGEEFVILLPKTDYTSAKIPLERIRKHIEEGEFLDSKVKVTASIGVAVYPDDRPLNIEELVTFADEAMYRAKAEGKNRIVFYSTLCTR